MAGSYGRCMLNLKKKKSAKLVAKRSHEPFAFPPAECGLSGSSPSLPTLAVVRLFNSCHSNACSGASYCGFVSFFP